MLIFKKTSTLAVRHIFDPEALGAVAEAVVKGSANILGGLTEEILAKVLSDRVKKVSEKVRSHFTDHSEKLATTLADANEKAWKTIEIALGGQGFWDRFASAEDRALREQVKLFLASSVKEDDPGYLTACLKELRQAKEKGLLRADGGFRPESLAEEVGLLARFDDPEELIAAECYAVEEVAREFQRLGYKQLGRLLAVTPSQGQPLLAMAAQYYFRRAVSQDPVLAADLNLAKLNAIDHHTQQGFAFLATIQERHGPKVDEALDGLTIIVVETRDAVLGIHEEFRRLNGEFRLFRKELTAEHSFSIRDDHERAAIEEAKRRYRALTDDQRRRFPRLRLDLSQLEIVAGDYKEALVDARAAAAEITEPQSKAKAHHAAYRASLELKKWDEALAELRLAAAADPRFAIWDASKYDVKRILGAGAFGVALLCHDTDLDRLVVIKTFEVSGLDRDVATRFREARILDALNDPGIINLHSYGFVDRARKQRPYLEIAHFADSLTLEDLVNQHGKLALDDLKQVAILTAKALQAAHQSFPPMPPTLSTLEMRLFLLPGSSSG